MVVCCFCCVQGDCFKMSLFTQQVQCLICSQYFDSDQFKDHLDKCAVLHSQLYGDNTKNQHDIVPAEEGKVPFSDNAALQKGVNEVTTKPYESYDGYWQCTSCNNVNLVVNLNGKSFCAICNTPKPNIQSHKIKILVKTLTDQIMEIEIEPSAKVQTCKEKVHQMRGFPVDQQRLIFAGKQMDDHKTLKSYGVDQDATVHLVLRLRGGVVEDQKGDEGANAYSGEGVKASPKISSAQPGMSAASNASKPQPKPSGNAEEAKYDDDDAVEGTETVFISAGDAINIAHNNILISNIIENANDNANNQPDDIFMQSGLGKLTKIIQQHLNFMDDQEKFVDAMLEDQDSNLQIAKRKAIAAEQEILLSIMMDVISMSKFIQNIVLMENLFNKQYTKQLKIEQENARLSYAKNIVKYEEPDSCALIRNQNIDSFQSLIFNGQSLHIDNFREWLHQIERKCKKQNIVIEQNSGAHVKKIARAFYKAFYVYKNENNDGFKQMTDILRTSLVFDSFTDLYRAFNIIDNNIKILRVKDRFQPDKVPFGYRDILINFYCPDTPRTKIVCELQLQHSLFYKYKKRSHDIYKKARLFERNGSNYAYEYAMEFAKPKIGDKDIFTYRYDDDATRQYDSDDSLDEKEMDTEKKIDEDLKMNGKDLLMDWGLKKYVSVMIDQEGWDDPLDWIDLEANDLKEDPYKFNTPHCKKFMRKYKNWRKRYKNQIGIEDED
eukprot:455998_1